MIIYHLPPIQEPEPAIDHRIHGTGKYIYLKNWPFEDYFPIKNGDIPCVTHYQIKSNKSGSILTICSIKPCNMMDQWL